MLQNDHKYIDLPIPELYDLPKDPHDENNLVSTDAAEAKTLRGEIPAGTWPPVDRHQPTSEEAMRLRSLGYVTGTAEPRATYGPEDDPKRLIDADHELHDLIGLYSEGRYQELIRKARDLIARHPDFGEAYEELALALRQLERGDEAVAVLRDGLTKARTNFIALQLGMTLAELGRARQASRCCDPHPPPTTTPIRCVSMAPRYRTAANRNRPSRCSTGR